MLAQRIVVITAVVMAVLWIAFFKSKESDPQESHSRDQKVSHITQAPKSEAVESSPSLERAEQQTTFPAQSTPPSKTASLIKPISPISLKDIAEVSGPQETTILFQRLSTELIHEFDRLAKTTDSNKIASRLTPLVQKFYYLKKKGDIIQPDQRLPISFKKDITRLTELWDQNPKLARAADDLFSRFDLLEYEHVPYQLRQELASH